MTTRRTSEKPPCTIWSCTVLYVGLFSSAHERVFPSGHFNRLRPLCTRCCWGAGTRALLKVITGLEIALRRALLRVIIELLLYCKKLGTLGIEMLLAPDLRSRIAISNCDKAFSSINSFFPSSCPLRRPRQPL